MTDDRPSRPQSTVQPPLPAGPRPQSTATTHVGTGPASGGPSGSATGPGPLRPATDLQALAERSKARQVAGSFDALIRTAKTINVGAAGNAGLGGLAGICGRTFDMLAVDPPPALHIDATVLRVDEEPALTADEDHGRWLLPTFMAGLRRIQANEECRFDDVQALALELAALRLQPAQLEQFADWLWSDGLEGFSTEVHTSFAEILDLSEDPAKQKLQIAAVRAEMAQTLVSDVKVTERDLNAAAVLPEFQAPLDAFAVAAEAGQLGLTAEEADALRKGVDESAFWVRQEISLALAHPALRRALPPPQVARSLVRVAAESFDKDFMALVAALSQHTDDYAKAVITALENEPVGDAIAGRAPLDDAGLQRLLHLLMGKSHKLAAGIARGLCERASADNKNAEPLAVAPAAVRLASTLGIKKFIDLVDIAALTPAGRTALAHIAVRAHADVEHLAAILASVPPQAAIQLLQGFPGPVLAKMEGTIGRLLRNGNPRERTALATILLDPARHTGASQLVGVLVETRAEGWELRTVRAAAEAAVRQGCAEPLLALQRNTAITLDIRILLLEVLAHSPLADEALKWRMAELLDADALRTRLVALRKERKS